MRGSRFLWLWLGAAILCASPVSADNLSDSDRAAARALGDEGNVLFNQGDYKGALDRFTRAIALVPAPTLALRQAETLERLGRLVEAAERYLALSKSPLTSDASPQYKAAVEKAAAQEKVVRARIPFLEVVLQGSGLDQAVLTLDGREVRRELWGVKRPLDPGTHTLKLVSGERQLQQEVSIAEKETRSVVLKLPEVGPAAASAQPVAATTPPASPTPSTQPSAPSEPSRQPTLGWIALGVGSAGLLLGGVSWALALGKRSDLDDLGCESGKCPPSLESEVNSYSTLRTLSFVGLGIGVVGLAAGSVLLLTSPARSEAPARVSVTPWLGLGQAGLGGRF